MKLKGAEKHIFMKLCMAVEDGNGLFQTLTPKSWLEKAMEKSVCEKIIPG